MNSQPNLIALRGKHHFDVVEFWVENRLMLELLTPTMAIQYLECLNPEQLPELIEQFTLVAAQS